MKIPFSAKFRTRRFAACTLLASMAAVPLVAYAQTPTCTNHACMNIDVMTNPGYQTGGGIEWQSKYYAVFAQEIGRPKVRGMRNDGDYEELGGDDIDVDVWFGIFCAACVKPGQWNQAFEGCGGSPGGVPDWTPDLPNAECVIH